MDIGLLLVDLTTIQHFIIQIRLYLGISKHRSLLAINVKDYVFIVYFYDRLSVTKVHL